MNVILNETWINKHLYMVQVGGEILYQFQAYDEELYEYWDYIESLQVGFASYKNECFKYKKLTKNNIKLNRNIESGNITFDFPDEETAFYFSLKYN